MIQFGIILGLGIAAFTRACVLHGKPRTGKHNGWCNCYLVCEEDCDQFYEEFDKEE